MRHLFALLLTIAALVVGAYVLLDPEDAALDNTARARAPGQFVMLEEGLTHFETAGADSGRPVVFAAGFSVPAYIWDPLFSTLADSGFRVIRYDYYGRGWSDRPTREYTQDLFARQLNQLLDSLGIAGPVDLAGLSFGGAVITSFADRYPDRIGSLIYVDPLILAPRRPRLRHRSALAWNLHMVFGGGTDEAATGQMADFLHPENYPDWVSRYREQQQFLGTRAAIRASHLGAAASESQMPLLRRIGESGRPVLLVWGRQDRIIPIGGSDSVRAAIPGTIFLPVDSAGHLPHIEQPDTVAAHVIGFLRSVRE
jgi:pimeloyl-ACP methyl ester carboxylesterase